MSLSMRKTLVLVAGVLGVCLIVGLVMRATQAWTYGLTGVGTCQVDGSFKATYTLDNSTEPDALNITASNRAVVPVGTGVPAGTTADFSETITADTTLTLKGNWAGDPTEQQRSVTVIFDTTCEQPEPPKPPKKPTKPLPPIVVDTGGATK